MSDVAQILGEFIAAWNAGQRPRLAQYLERVPPSSETNSGSRSRRSSSLLPSPPTTSAPGGR